MMLRLAPWRARSVARMLQEWTSGSRIFHHRTQSHLDELALSRTLKLAAAVHGGGGDEPITPSRGSRGISNWQRLRPWKSWGSVRRTCPQCNALPWLMPRNGSQNVTAAWNLLTHCLSLINLPLTPWPWTSGSQATQVV